MAKYKSIYGPVGDRARIIWSFLTPIPLILILVFTYGLTLGSVVAYGVAAGAVESAGGVLNYLEEGAPLDGPFLLALPFAFAILCTAFWARVIENRPVSSMGFGVGAWLSRYVRGFVVGALFLLTVVGLIFIAGGYEIEEMAPLAAAPDPARAALLLAAYLVAFLVQGAGEETVFRGWWMSALAAP